MSQNKDSWIEQIYQYVEYYYWEPQYLNKKTSIAEVRATMRKTEAPLNAILNVTFRLLPSRILTNLLSLFSKADFGKEFALIDILSMIPETGYFAQPDITLETNTSRIFIETKIKSDFTLSQTYKYIFLHAWWNQRTGIYNKQPFIFFLSPNNIHKQWIAKERNEIFVEDNSVTSIVEYLNENPLPLKLGNLHSTELLHKDAMQILNSQQLGSTTWQNIGDYLNNELEDIKQQIYDDSLEVITKIIYDFLLELKNRNLYIPNI
jgi:hypothetical protein